MRPLHRHGLFARQPPHSLRQQCSRPKIKGGSLRSRIQLISILFSNISQSRFGSFDISFFCRWSITYVLMRSTVVWLILRIPQESNLRFFGCVSRNTSSNIVSKFSLFVEYRWLMADWGGVLICALISSNEIRSESSSSGVLVLAVRSMSLILATSPSSP